MMNEEENGWLLVLTLAMTVFLTSCVTYPADSTVKNMSVSEARKVLSTELIGRCTWGYKTTELTGTCKSITDVSVTSRRLFVTDARGIQSIYVFSDLPRISHTGQILLLEGKSIFMFRSVFDGDDVISALYVLRKNAIATNKDADEYATRFTASLSGYRHNAALNAALPADANRYKVQAEGAIRDQAFDDAIDLYGEALKIAPWWPAGHFNRALVLGETGDYEMASREMNYYLQLVPDALDARAAQEKIYEWERQADK